MPNSWCVSVCVYVCVCVCAREREREGGEERVCVRIVVITAIEITFVFFHPILFIQFELQFKKSKQQQLYPIIGCP